MNQTFTDYYRCPESGLDPAEIARQFSSNWRSQLDNAAQSIASDPLEMVDALRLERYADEELCHLRSASVLRRLYYAIRPLLPISVRKHAQKFQLRDWNKRTFPAWPVDQTVENIMEQMMALHIRALNVTAVPFIWFWPESFRACAILTHDVEYAGGRDFCSSIMDLEDSFELKSSFQLVPEDRYKVLPWFLDGIRTRGFEVNVHDLNHDGHLYSNRDEFLRRAKKINSYMREYQAAGFRSAVLYRNLSWYDAFEFDYDMSVPNVAHLDPQRGGCCTVMPYFIGKVLELPLTTTQDYSLFHILGDYSIELWKKQIDLIMDKYGLVSFNIHPDYVAGRDTAKTHKLLLEYIRGMRSSHALWMALPGEVNRWWRDRARMSIVPDGGGWRIEGHGSERARLAYASVQNGQVSYSLD